MDDELRTDLWNMTFLAYIRPAHQQYGGFEKFLGIWAGLMKQDADRYSSVDFGEVVKDWIKHNEWHLVYDLLEELIAVSDYSDAYNKILAKNLAGYRLLDRIVVPIADSHELAEIETALVADRDVVKRHLQQAIRLLADRDDPDYPNSIKESISAVESLLMPMTGENTLGKALQKLKRTRSFAHPALLEAWSKLYGWASDEDGIRHGGEAVPTDAITQALARYVLITCSAFINLMTAEKAAGRIVGGS